MSVDARKGAAGRSHDGARQPASANPLRPEGDLGQPTYLAVSLDLWYTALYHIPGADKKWDEDRLSAAGELLRLPDGGTPAIPAIATAMEQVNEHLAASGLNPGKIDPGALLLQCAARLGADLRVGPDEAAERFSSAGLTEHPPEVNPEAVVLVRARRSKEVPVILLSNTARRASSWDRFLRESAGLEFDHILTSCEVGSAKPDGRIFRVASERLGVPPSEILHVGDRWELDVEGALGAGFGAALYRGLSHRYPEGMYPATDPGVIGSSRVRCIDRLDELLDGSVRSP